MDTCRASLNEPVDNIHAQPAVVAASLLPCPLPVLEFSVGAFLSRMCCPCTLTVNSMFAEYAFAFPHFRNRSLVKTSKPHTP